MVEMMEIGAADRQRFTECVEHSPGGDFRQTYEWGEVRARDGWTVRRFLAARDGEIAGAASVLAGRLPHLPFRLLYVPSGPVMDYHAADLVAAFAVLLRRLAAEAGAGFVRIDPALLATDEMAHQNLLAAGFVHSQLTWSYWNAPTEVLRIDLSPSEDVLFRRMRKSKRYDVARFEREGNVVDVSRDPGEFWHLYHLLRDLGRRKGFMVRGERYWQSLWDDFVERGRGILLVARSSEKALGYILSVICGHTCFTLHAADDPAASKRSERPNDALYWASVRYARSAGCSVLDMMGYVDDSHLRFKLGLGADLVKLTGYHDLVVRPALHRLFSLAENHLLPRVVPTLARLRRWERPPKPPLAVPPSHQHDRSESLHG